MRVMVRSLSVASPRRSPCSAWLPPGSIVRRPAAALSACGRARRKEQA
jgi:hypothetical protein